MKRLLSFSLMLPLLLAACDGDVKSTLGLDREAPDEFTVVSRPPLSMPPDFTLRPPRPGEDPLRTPADAKARGLLTGQTASPMSTGTSGGASGILTRAGADSADTAIREKLAQDAKTPLDTSNAKTLMDQISGAEKKEPTVDAEKEVERLRSNKQAGKPINEGEVPENKPTTDSLIDRIF